jgi:hypothetical protein
MIKIGHPREVKEKKYLFSFFYGAHKNLEQFESGSRMALHHLMQLLFPKY